MNKSKEKFLQECADRTPFYNTKAEIAGGLLFAFVAILIMFA